MARAAERELLLSLIYVFWSIRARAALILIKRNIALTGKDGIRGIHTHTGKRIVVKPFRFDRLWMYLGCEIGANIQ